MKKIFRILVLLSFTLLITVGYDTTASAKINGDGTVRNPFQIGDKHPTIWVRDNGFTVTNQESDVAHKRLKYSGYVNKEGVWNTYSYYCIDSRGDWWMFWLEEHDYANSYTVTTNEAGVRARADSINGNYYPKTCQEGYTWNTCAYALTADWVSGQIGGKYDEDGNYHSTNIKQNNIIYNIESGREGLQEPSSEVHKIGELGLHIENPSTLNGCNDKSRSGTETRMFPAIEVANKVSTDHWVSVRTLKITDSTKPQGEDLLSKLKANKSFTPQKHSSDYPNGFYVAYVHNVIEQKFGSNKFKPLYSVNSLIGQPPTVGDYGLGMNHKLRIPIVGGMPVYVRLWDIQKNKLVAVENWYSATSTGKTSKKCLAYNIEADGGTIAGQTNFLVKLQNEYSNDDLSTDGNQEVFKEANKYIKYILNDATASDPATITSKSGEKVIAGIGMYIDNTSNKTKWNPRDKITTWSPAVSQGCKSQTISDLLIKKDTKNLYSIDLTTSSNLKSFKTFNKSLLKSSQPVEYTVKGENIREDDVEKQCLFITYYVTSYKTTDDYINHWYVGKIADTSSSNLDIHLTNCEDESKNTNSMKGLKDLKTDLKCSVITTMDKYNSDESELYIRKSRIKNDDSPATVYTLVGGSTYATKFKSTANKLASYFRVKTDDAKYKTDGHKAKTNEVMYLSEDYDVLLTPHVDLFYAIRPPVIRLAYLSDYKYKNDDPSWTLLLDEKYNINTTLTNRNSPEKFKDDFYFEGSYVPYEFPESVRGIAKNKIQTSSAKSTLSLFSNVYETYADSYVFEEADCKLEKVVFLEGSVYEYDGGVEQAFEREYIDSGDPPGYELIPGEKYNVNNELKELALPSASGQFEMGRKAAYIIAFYQAPGDTIPKNPIIVSPTKVDPVPTIPSPEPSEPRKPDPTFSPGDVTWKREDSTVDFDLYEAYGVIKDWTTFNVPADHVSSLAENESRSFIVNDYEGYTKSSSNYDAEVNIPTSEYLKVYSHANYGEENIAIRQHTVKWRFVYHPEVTFSEHDGTCHVETWQECAGCDRIYDPDRNYNHTHNWVTKSADRHNYKEDQIITVESNEVAREVIFYELASGESYTPESLRVYNEALTERGYAEMDYLRQTRPSFISTYGNVVGPSRQRLEKGFGVEYGNCPISSPEGGPTLGTAIAFAKSKATALLNGAVGTDQYAQNGSIDWHYGNGIQSISDTGRYRICPLPMLPNERSTEENVFKEEDLKIPVSCSNGLKPSNIDAVSYAHNNQSNIYIGDQIPHGESVATIEYKKYKSEGWSNDFTSGSAYSGIDKISHTPAVSFPNYYYYGIYVNDVNIHTPTVCNSWIISDQTKVQRTDFDKINYKSSLVLDTPFLVHVDATGDCTSDPGYGYRDYSRFLSHAVVDGVEQPVGYVKFPFAVIRCDNGDWAYYNPNIWIPCALGDTQFYMPTTDAMLDSNNIEFQCRAENCWIRAEDQEYDEDNVQQNDKLNAKYYEIRTNTPRQQLYANMDEDKYIAFNFTDWAVCGRIYDFKVDDITDYPTWESEFRNSDGALRWNSLKSGLTDRDGVANNVDPLQTLVPKVGTNDKYPNIYALQFGYAIKYSFETVGEFADDTDSVTITPRFSWISSDGNTRIDDVSVYYNDDINGSRQTLVKAGSEKDVSNQKVYSIKEYGVDQDILDKTSESLNFKQTADFTSIKSNLFCPSKIVVTSNLRTFDGLEHKTTISSALGEKSNFADLKMAVAKFAESTGVTKNKIYQSVQNWYGEYYLPSETFVTSASDADVKSATEEGFSGTESIWFKDGYLLVGFDIVANNNGNSYITYDNTGLEFKVNQGEEGDSQLVTIKPGECNMWDWESFNKVNSSSYKTGDAFTYDIAESKRASSMNQYTSGGTH